MGLSSKCQNSFETSLFFNYYEKKLSHHFSASVTCKQAHLGELRKKILSAEPPTRVANFPLPPDIAKESLLADYNQGGVRPKLDSLGVNEAHLL